MDSKYKWSILLDKFVNNDISQNELAELHRQMDSSSLKRKQFEEVTAPGYFVKSMREFLSAGADYNLEDSEVELPEIKHQGRAVRYLIAAASVLLGLALVAVYYVRPINTKETKTPVVTHAVVRDPVIKSYSYILLPTGKEIKFNELGDGAIYVTNGLVIKRTGVLISIDTNEMYRSNQDDIFYLVTAAMPKDLKLPDGSKFSVDSASFIGFKLQNLEKERAVRIFGQAYCNINRKVNKTFAIYLNDSVEVNVTGTIFHVRNYKNENPTVKLISGEVKLKRGEEAYEMKEGQTVEFTKEKKFRLLEKLNFDEQLSRKDRVLTFEQKDIREVMAEVGNMYNKSVEFIGNMPQKIAIGTIPVNASWADIESAIETQYGVTIEVRKDWIQVSNP